MAHRGDLWVDRYRLVRKLGSGSAATVWEAEDELLGRTVAVKALHVADDEHDESSRRFLREARLGASLRHEGLVTVYDVVDDGSTVLLVMEIVQGGTLAQRLAEGPLDRAQALGVLEAVAAALDYAHEHGVVHRDVKPANILIGRDGRARLADLGIASARGSTRITRTGSMLGTAAYIAPEQVSGDPPTPAADVYALAAVAFEALSGRRVRVGDTPLALLHQAGSGEAPDLREAWPDAPPAAAQALARGLARDPADRPASAGALLAALRAALPAGEPPPAPAAPAPRRPAPAAPARAPRRPAPASPQTGPRRGRPRAPVLLAIAGLLAVAGAAVALAVGAGDEDAGRSGSRASTAAEERPASSGETQRPATTQARRAADEPGATPQSAVRGFYTSAADDDFDAAWRLAGPKMRAAFGNDRARLEGDLGSLRSISFPRLEVTERSRDTATLEIRSIARHTDRTDRCSGTLSAVRASGGWRVDPAGLTCRSSPA